MSSTKRMKYDRNCSAADESLVQMLPSSSIHDLPTDLIKNIFRFVGKGSYCFIGPVSKDFCYNYLTIDLSEDSCDLQEVEAYSMALCTQGQMAVLGTVALYTTQWFAATLIL